MQIMLSELQQKNVWDGWLSAEIRANYFAALCRRYQLIQRVATWATLVASSGAVAAVLANLSDENLWLRPALVIVTAALSLWSLVVNYNKHVTDCSDLHFRWKKLAIDYEALWNDMYSERAPERLAALREREAELGRSGNTFPNKKRLMLKWQRHTVGQHATA